MSYFDHSILSICGYLCRAVFYDEVFPVPYYLLIIQCSHANSRQIKLDGQRVITTRTEGWDGRE